MCGQDRVVWLDDGGGDLWRWIDGKLELGLLAIINAEPLHQQRGESRSGTSAEAVEDEESLESSTLVSQLASTIQNKVNDLLADGVMASGVVVGGVFLASNQLFWMEQLPIGASTYLI